MEKVTETSSDKYIIQIQRGERLRRLRALANLDRKTICQISGISIHTFKGWEIGRYGGLTESGAEKTIECLLTVGVKCTKDWLIHGIGDEPYLIRTSNNQSYSDKYKLENIQKEILAFHANYQNVVSLEVPDDGMIPFFSKGDFVAGIKQVGENINLLLNKNCIVKINNKDLMVRSLIQGNTEGLYNLMALNYQAGVLPLQVDVNIEFAALVSRHYKIDLE